jgi:hypothetical protein
LRDGDDEDTRLVKVNPPKTKAAKKPAAARLKKSGVVGSKKK